MQKLHTRRSLFLALAETIEPRIILSGSPLVEPPVLASQDGVLTATLTAQSTPITIDGQTITDADTYNGLLPGPTLQFNPGDEVNLDLVNNLVDGADAQGDAYGPTNLHLHGLHVSPDGDSDNVFIQVDPGQSFQYHYQIPMNQPEGLYWYHAHVHGLVSAQVYDGLAGMLVIGQADGGAKELSGLTQQVMGIKNVDTDPDTGNIPDQDAEDPSDSAFTINGQVDPSVTMRPGEAQVWSMINMGNDTFHDVALVDPNGVRQKLYVVAQDGQPFRHPVAVTDLTFSSGKRYSFIVQTSSADPAGTKYSLETLPFFDGQGEWPQRELASITVAGSAMAPFAIPKKLTLPINPFHDLSGARIAQNRTVTFDQTDTADLLNGAQFPNPPVFQARENTVEQWTLVNVTPFIHVFHIHQNDFQVMSVNGTAIPADGTPVYIPNYSYPNSPSVSDPQGETIIGGSLADIIDLPAANPVTGQPGKVVIRMAFRDYTGTYVYHCHILDHEDMGMMATINVVPDDPIAVTGSSAGQLPVVHVYDSLTGQLQTSFMAFAPGTVTGGVNVVAANLYGDNRQQIVVSSGGGVPMVRVFNAYGIPLPGPLGRGFLAYDPSFRGSVNIAVGDVNLDGTEDIITGEGAAANSQPRVRAFSGKDGSMLTDFLAFESTFTGGVSVAVGDFAANGRPQIAVGRGAGSTPEVKIFRASDQLVMDDFLAFDSTFTGGVNLSAGWYKGFGLTDLIVSSARGADNVAVFSNQMTMDQLMMIDMNDTVNLSLWKQFSVPTFNNGIKVAPLFDPNGSGYDLMVESAGAPAGAVRIYQTGTLNADGAIADFSFGNPQIVRRFH